MNLEEVDLEEVEEYVRKNYKLKIISDVDGEPVNLSEVQNGIQKTIEKMVHEARRKSEYPIFVTPNQIYRAFTRLPRDAAVTEAQASEIEQAMDVLMNTRVKICCLEDQEGGPSIEGKVILAVKDEITSGKARYVEYTVYDVLP